MREAQNRQAKMVSDTTRQGGTVKFYKDRIAVATAVLGAVLMALSVAWHVNPVEGSVMPGFIKEGILGSAVFVILIGTSVPTWLIAFPLALFLPNSLVGPALVLLQGLLYFWLGKAISTAVRRLSRHRAPSE
jgi:hypothetical protein